MKNTDTFRFRMSCVKILSNDIPKMSEMPEPEDPSRLPAYAAMV